MSPYAFAPVFLIRMAGVPFSPLQKLATRQSTAIARELVELERERAQAADEVERFFASRVRLLDPHVYQALRVAVRSNRAPVAVAGDQPPIFTNYARVATALEVKRKELQRILQEEVCLARAALVSAGQTILPDYLVFAAEGVGATMLSELAKYPDQAADFGERHNAARKAEQSIWTYLQRLAAKNDTFSRFGPSSWGLVENTAVPITGSIEPLISAREVFLERWTAHHLARAISADPDARPVSVRALEPHAFAKLAAEISAWPQGTARSRWLPITEAILAAAAEFAEAPSAPERQRAMSLVRTHLQSFGSLPDHHARFLYSAHNPIGEECFRRGSIRIGADTINQVAAEAAPWIDLWRDTYSFVASRAAAGLRRIFISVANGRDAVSLPEFLEACEAARLSLTGPGLVALATIAFQEVKAAFAERLRPHTAAAEYALTHEDCAVVRSRFEYPAFDEYTYPSADLQISAASFDAMNCGDFTWVIGELHPAVALLHHGFYWSCPDKPRLNRALSETACGKPTFHFGFFAADFTSHTTLRLFDALPDLAHFVAPSPGDPRWQTTSPDDAEVYVDAETGDVCLRRGTDHQYLGSFARSWLIPLGFHPFQFAVAPHTPRLKCGDVVVQRESWTVRAEEFSNGNFTGVSPDLVVAMEKLRASRQLPRFVYIRPTEQALRRSGAEGRDKDTKPVFIDLESYLSMEIFYRWLNKAGELEVTEMLPDPDHLCWQEEDGPHTFELRTLIVPRS